MDMGKMESEVKQDVSAAIADAKKTSHNAWFWVGVMSGMLIGFGMHWMFF